MPVAPRMSWPTPLRAWMAAHARLLRWTALPILIVLAYGWSAENASRAGYWPIAAQDVQAFTGTLVAPKGRPKGWSSLVRQDDGSTLSLGCTPNSSWSSDACLERHTLPAFAGQRVRGHYVRYARAMHHPNIVLDLAYGTGAPLLTREARLAALRRDHATDSAQGFASTLPVGIIVALLASLIFEGYAWAEGARARRG